jgi:hypothetical protein
MSNLKHLNTEQLVDVLRKGVAYRRKLENEIHNLEQEAHKLRQQLAGSLERRKWAMSYLEEGII